MRKKRGNLAIPGSRGLWITMWGEIGGLCSRRAEPVSDSGRQDQRAPERGFGLIDGDAAAG